MKQDIPATARCKLCHREVPAALITLHHLQPRSRGGKPEQRIALCKPCHKQLHATFSNIELEKVYPTLEALRAAPKLQPFLKWIRKQKPGRNFRTIQSKQHPESRRR
ncbi:MAG TPA: HNH endonuclease signature motif containing protein [Tepidisphaeraceae bacterium]|nr:HNH endonuclease signature motif containing protein [Tepidisphaeraceae bacterium]